MSAAETGATAYFDSHLHLTDDRFSGEVDEVVARAAASGVGEMVTVGTSPEDARAAAELAGAVDGVWSTVGLHPHAASAWDAAVEAVLRDLLDRPGVVAVGETGLDFHYENSPRDDQLGAFRAQLELGAATELPVIVHSRDADAATAEVLREAGGGVRGVLHCFTGGDGLLDAALELGWYVSFSGIVTFGSFRGGHRVRRVPDDRLLVETDSPYLSPAPVRGRRNEPSHLPHTCRRVAELRENTPEETARITRANARRFYGLAGAGAPRPPDRPDPDGSASA